MSLKLNLGIAYIALAVLLPSSICGASLLNITKTPYESKTAGVNFLNASNDGVSLAYSVTGTTTAGVFSQGETITQAVTGATAVIASPYTSTTRLVLKSLSGTPNSTDIWNGTNSDSFKPTTLPSAVTAIDLSSGADVTGTIISTSPSPLVTTSVTINGTVQTGQFIVFRLQSGNNNQRVLIDALVVDNVTGDVSDGQITLVIQSGIVR